MKFVPQVRAAKLLIIFSLVVVARRLLKDKTVVLLVEFHPPG
jgi:hypothetical protein